MSSCAEGGTMDILDGLFVDSILYKRDTVINSNNDTTFIEIHDTIRKPLNVKIEYIEKIMDQEPNSANQGASCYGNYLFSCTDYMTYFYVYDLYNKSFLKRHRTNQKNTKHHCNNICFSNIFYSDEDIFPLLFVSQQRKDPKEVQVCRLIGGIDDFQLSVVSTILLPTDVDLYIRNHADVVLDNDNNSMIAYTITDDLLLCTYKFDTPQVLNNDTIYLSKQDIKETNIYNTRYSAKQGAVIDNGFLYVVKGIPNRSPIGLTIINLFNHSWKELDLFHRGLGYEPEGLFFYDNELYCTTYSNGIFRICLTMQ